MLALHEINFRRTPVTLIVAASIVALELICTLDQDRRLAYYNEYLGLLAWIWRGQLWRPFTSTLMHGGLLHAGFNVYWLLVFGPALERRFNSYRTLGLIVLFGYVSMLPEYVIGSYHREDPIMIVGLSGVVYGMFGILWIGRRFKPELEQVCDRQTSQLLLGWFVLCIVLTQLHVMNVANMAHGAGFLFGVLYGLAIFDVRRRLRWTLLSCIASGLVLATLIVCPGHHGYERVKRGGGLWWHRAIPQAEARPVNGQFAFSNSHDQLNSILKTPTGTIKRFSSLPE